MKEGSKLIFFGLLVVVLAIVLRTPPIAHAQNGPSVSLGTNPVFNYYESGWSRFNVNSTGKQLTLNIPSDQDLIITSVRIQEDVYHSNYANFCLLEVDGTQISYSAISSLRVDANSQIKIVSSNGYCGSSATSYNKIYIEGYLTHQ